MATTSAPAALKAAQRPEFGDGRLAAFDAGASAVDVLALAMFVFVLGADMSEFEESPGAGVYSGPDATVAASGHTTLVVWVVDATAPEATLDEANLAGDASMLFARATHR